MVTMRMRSCKFIVPPLMSFDTPRSVDKVELPIRSERVVS